jgi:hypothetical protein
MTILDSGDSIPSQGGPKMKRAIVTAMMLLAGTTWAVSQDYPSQKGQSSSSAQRTTIEGCLGRTDGGFTLTDKAGKRYELTGDTAMLKDHISHEVQIDGTKAESSTPTGTPEATTNRIEARIDVSGVKHISETCKAKSETERPMSEKPPTPR